MYITKYSLIVAHPANSIEDCYNTNEHNQRRITMKSRIRLLSVIFLGAASIFLLGTLLVTAQDNTPVADVACRPALTSLWSAASEACLGKPTGYICNGGSAPQAEPAGNVSNALGPIGALVPMDVVDAIRSPAIVSAGNGGGILWMRPSDQVPMTAMLIGDVSLRDLTKSDVAPWQVMQVETNALASDCAAAPLNAFVVQSRLGQPIRIVINGVSLDLDGTLVVQTETNNTRFTLLSGQMRALAFGQVQTVYAGQALTAAYNPGDFTIPTGFSGVPGPLNVRTIENLPISLLDRPILLPQPGYVTTQGAVNMRSAPTTNAGLIVQVPAGAIMTVLGRNVAGDWYHVQLESGETGWMFADLLVKHVGDIAAVYNATPLPPQRLGQLGLQARVNAPLGVNVRSAPDVSFRVLTTLPFNTQVDLVARSPYSPWVKITAGEVEGWLALLTLDTDAVISALPIEYDVPPPPPPTRVPGSFGNAFPDPNEGG